MSSETGFQSVMPLFQTSVVGWIRHDETRLSKAESSKGRHGVTVNVADVMELGAVKPAGWLTEILADPVATREIVSVALSDPGGIEMVAGTVAILVWLLWTGTSSARPPASDCALCGELPGPSSAVNTVAVAVPVARLLLELGSRMTIPDLANVAVPLAGPYPELVAV